jgi:hypothetical protein
MNRVVDYGIFVQEISNVVGSREAALERLTGLYPPEDGWVVLNAQFHPLDSASVACYVFLQKWDTEG